MTLFQSILLGIIQGITEFLPISSSAHLVIVPYLFNWQIPVNQAFIFNVLVQVATLVGVIVYFWSDFLQIGRAMLQDVWQRHPLRSAPARLGWLIILANIPTGIIGLLLKDQVEQAFNSPILVAVFLWVTGGLLVLAERVGQHEKGLDHLQWRDALFIGTSQALAIFPGISRSGASITGGMLRGLERPAAARFSFLLSLPIMLAAGALASIDLVQTPGVVETLPVLLPGFIAAAVVGYLSIRWLLQFLTRWRLTVFSIYCICLGTCVLVVAWLR